MYQVSYSRAAEKYLKKIKDNNCLRRLKRRLIN